MKFIDIQIENEETGALASCHIVSSLTIDYTNKSVSAVIQSYVSCSKREAGKQPIFNSYINFSAVPEYDELPYEWVLKELVKPTPEHIEPYDMQKYVFAGGKIKDCEK